LGSFTEDVRRLTVGAHRGFSHSKIIIQGTTVLPRPVRVELGLKPGDTVRFIINNGTVTLVKNQNTDDNPLQAFDVVVVPFPFSDRMAGKKHPAHRPWSCLACDDDQRPARQQMSLLQTLKPLECRKHQLCARQKSASRTPHASFAR
jgi:hypothetical protein